MGKKQESGGWKLLRVRVELLTRLEAYCVAKGKKMSTVAAEAIKAYLGEEGSVSDREVVRCPHCELRQFRTMKNVCRRCGKPLPPPPPVEVVPSEPFVPVAEAVRLVLTAHRSGKSQRSLAEKLGTPRTYISKIEHDNARPHLRQLERFAAAFEMSMYELVVEIETMKWMLRQTERTA